MLLGKKVEKDAKSAINDIELPKVELDNLTDRKELDKQLRGWIRKAFNIASILRLNIAGEHSKLDCCGIKGPLEC